MKFRALLSLLFAGMVVSAVAGAQNQPAQNRPAQNQSAQNQPAPESSDPLFFVKTAAHVARNVQHDNLQGYLAIYVSDKNWAEGAKDGDLGPFLKIKEAKPGRSAAFFYTGEKDSAICVYFDDKTPFGVVAVKADPGKAIQPSDISGAYKPVSKDMLRKSEQELRFSSTDVNTDDGVSLPAFTIEKPGGFPKP
jgi:hypothetical protein